MSRGATVIICTLIVCAFLGHVLLLRDGLPTRTAPSEHAVANLNRLQKQVLPQSAAAALDLVLLLKQVLLQSAAALDLVLRQR